MKYANNIEKPTYGDPLIKKGATLSDTIKLIRKISSRDKHQLTGLSQKLKGVTVEQTAHNIWKWVKQNIPYKPDKREDTGNNTVEELVRTPARVIEDAKNGIGSDCDCYTTFISAILKNLDIDHYYKVVAWDKPNEFNHIYPVAIDKSKQEFAIDCIPEVTGFNIELGYTNHKKFKPMDLYELNGAIQAATEKIDLQDLKEELNAPLHGFDDEDEDEYLSMPEVYQSLFGRLELVDSPQEADYILDGVTFVDNVLAKQLKDARQALRNEFKKPTALSRVQNTAKELAIIEDVIGYWHTPQRQEVLRSAILDSEAYRQFYIEIANGTEATLNGDNSVDLYLKYILDEDIKKYEALDGWFKKALKKVGSKLKKVGKAVGKGIKKTFKAVHRYNPATMTARATLLGILKSGGGMLFIAAYAPAKYKSNPKIQEKSKRANLIINKLTKLIAMKRSNFDKYVRQGIERRFGSIDKAYEKIAKGQLKGAGGSGDSLGAFTAIAGAVLKLWGFIKKLFKKKPKDPQLTASDFNSESGVVTPSDFSDANNYPNNDYTASDTYSNDDYPDTNYSNTKTMKTQATNQNNPNAEDKPSTGEKIKAFIKKHKTKLIITVISITLLIIGYVWWKKSQGKRKPALSGARRRKRTYTKRKGRRKALNGQHLIVTRQTVKVKNTGNRLKRMHRIARELREKHPKTQYSTLLKRAAAMMRNGKK